MIIFVWVSWLTHFMFPFVATAKVFFFLLTYYLHLNNLLQCKEAQWTFIYEKGEIYKVGIGGFLKRGRRRRSRVLEATIKRNNLERNLLCVLILDFFSFAFWACVLQQIVRDISLIKKGSKKLIIMIWEFLKKFGKILLSFLRDRSYSYIDNLSLFLLQIINLFLCYLCDFLEPTKIIKKRRKQTINSK